MGRAAENHYPASPLAEIMALDVRSIAAADCVLFLWSTVPMLDQALQVTALGLRVQKQFHLGQGSHGDRLLGSQPDRK